MSLMSSMSTLLRPAHKSEKITSRPLTFSPWQCLLCSAATSTLYFRPLVMREGETDRQTRTQVAWWCILTHIYLYINNKSSPCDALTLHVMACQTCFPHRCYQHFCRSQVLNYKRKKRERGREKMPLFLCVLLLWNTGSKYVQRSTIMMRCWQVNSITDSDLLFEKDVNEIRILSSS